MEGYRGISHLAETVTHLLQALIDAPKAVAELINAFEKVDQKVSHTCFFLIV